MTDHIDELLSAYLDGEATADEVARVEADATLRGRLAELRAAADVIGTPVAPRPATSIDAAITTSVQQHERVRPVVVLAQRRRLVAALSIAAAVLLVGAIAAGLARSRHSTTSQTAATVSTLASDRSPSAYQQAAAGAAVGPRDLGSFRDVATLLQAARAAVTSPLAAAADTPADANGAGTAAGGAGPTPEAAPSTTACPAPTDGTVELAASAQLDGEPVDVFVVALADGSSAVEVFDVSCALVARAAA